jgi:hypothetical protein
MMGRWKKDENHFLPNNKLVQEPERNEENRSPDPDSNETRQTMTKNPMKSTRTI